MERGGRTMERSREEMAKIHKEKCRELKLVRAKMAQELGVELHQRECTYEGYCSGTCPKCAAEERVLNEAILRRQEERQAASFGGCARRQDDALSGSSENNVFRKGGGITRSTAQSRVAAAGLAAIVSLGLSGCMGTAAQQELDGDVQIIDEGMEYGTEQADWENTESELEGLMPETGLTEQEEKPSESEGTEPDESVEESEAMIMEIEGDVAPIDEPEE